MMATNQEFLQAVSAIDDAISEQRDLALPSTGELCAIYKTIKGPVSTILPIVELIPVYGKAIAKALRLLLQFGDTVCP